MDIERIIKRAIVEALHARGYVKTRIFRTTLDCPGPDGKSKGFLRWDLSGGMLRLAYYVMPWAGGPASESCIPLSDPDAFTLFEQEFAKFQIFIKI